MMLSATLLDMDTRHITRQIAGSIVRDELARQGIKQEKAAQRMGVARSTLSRVIEGAEPVRSETLRGVEGLLGLPRRRFLDFVIDGDAERLAKLREMDRGFAASCSRRAGRSRAGWCRRFTGQAPSAGLTAPPQGQRSHAGGDASVCVHADSGMGRGWD
jgi:transcriptional regulator with XRE-family HTH domain